jgi:hypothetical protein
MSVNKEIIRSIYAHLNRKHGPGKAGESGQALPIVLAALALGIMVVAPFLSHASSNLISSQNYKLMLYEQYSADAGIEQAIWRLDQDDLALKLTDVNDTTSYTLDKEVNNIQPVIKVTRISSNTGGENQDTFKVQSRAGATTITAEVLLKDGQVKIESWQVTK